MSQLSLQSVTLYFVFMFLTLNSDYFLKQH